MNKLMIIGNLCKDPDLRTTQSGVDVCSFTVAVNRRKKGTEQETDFFRVTAWRELALNCGKYLAKGRKVCVIGEVSVSTYTSKDGKPGASLEVTAQDVEFLTPANTVAYQETQKTDPQTGYTVEQPEDLPF